MERNTGTGRKMAGILRLICLTAFISILAFPCFGDGNRQRIVPLDSEIYKDIDTLYLIKGLTPPSYARPWSEDEIDMILSKLDPDHLEGAEKLAYDNIIKSFQKRILLGKEEQAGVAIKLKANLEGYVKTDDDRDEWEHGYEERLPLVDIPFEFFLWNNFYIDFNLTLREAHDVVTDCDYDYCNVPEKIQNLDPTIPFRAFMSAGGNHWNVQFGRDKLSWGNGETGNLVLSDYSDFYNVIKFTTYWKVLKFTTIYAGMESHLTKEEKEIDKTDPGLTQGNYDNFRERYKALMAHRLEARITDKVSVAATEAIIFGNKYPELSNINPVTIFHSVFAPECSNSLMSLEADYAPCRGLDIYAQFAMDECKLAIESDSSRPTALGYMLGARYVMPVSTGFLTLKLEGAKTDPYLYNRWHPLTRYTNRRRYWSYIEDGYMYVDKPTGYEHGPDAMVFYLAGEYRIPDDLKLGAEVTMKFLGELNDSLSDPFSYNGARNRISPTGDDVARELVIGLHGEKRLNRSFKVGADAYYINIDNYHNIGGKTINDFEIAAHVSYEL